MYLLFDIINAALYVEGTIERPDPRIDPETAAIWSFNDSYIRMLIGKNIASDEKIHIRGCKTAYHMWKNLSNIHHTAGVQVQTDQRRVLEEIKAQEGDDIPLHLIKLKKQWDQTTYLGDSEYKKMFDNKFFKAKIATSLLRSWDGFTGPYVRGNIDDDPLLADPLRKANSQQMIGCIKQEYGQRLNDARRHNDPHNPKGTKSTPSLTDWMSDPDQANNGGTKDKQQCKHCGKGGHHTLQCRHLGKNKCHKCKKYGHDIDKCNQGSDSNRRSSNQGSDNRRSGNNNNGNKRSRTEAQIADADKKADKEVLNVSLHGRSVALHLEDDPTNVDNDNECKTTRTKKYKVHYLYDWLADSGTTSHITHETRSIRNI
jgi:hypothetical protein